MTKSSRLLNARLKALVRRFTSIQTRERLKKIRAALRAARRAFARPRDEHWLARDLRRAGILPGDAIMVHTSLSSMSNVKGGAETVIRALMEAVTPKGTILMPAFCKAEDAFEGSRSGEPVDLRTMRSVNGKIPETFRTMSGVFRSSHPFSPVCAWGANAEWIVAGHENDFRIAHGDSPLAKLMKIGGKTLSIGTDMATVSFYHVVEDTWDAYPLRLYLPPEHITYIDAHGVTVTRAIAHYDREKTRVRIDNDSGLPVREYFARYMREAKIRHDFTLGGAASFWMPVASLYEEVQKLAMRGITIYSTLEDLE